MKVNKLNISFDKIEKIIHFSDLHIRLNSRHDEYRECLEKLYDGIKLLPEKSIVVFAGDAFHTKVEMSPEAIQLASEVFRKIASIRPLVLVAGNHDALLNNKNRLDNISPIVDALNDKNIFYLKESGLFGAGNILFNNFSVFDDVEKYIKCKDIPNKIKSQYDKVVCLFHGPIYGMETDLGYTVSDKTATAELFDGCDIAMCGDIHRLQNVYIEKNVSDDEVFKYLSTGDWEIVK